MSSIKTTTLNKCRPHVAFLQSHIPPAIIASVKLWEKRYGYLKISDVKWMHIFLKIR